MLNQKFNSSGIKIKSGKGCGGAISHNLLGERASSNDHIFYQNRYFYPIQDYQYCLKFYHNKNINNSTTKREHHESTSKNIIGSMATTRKS